MRSVQCIQRVMIYDKADDVIEELFESRLTRYQNSLETSIKYDFILDFLNLLYQKCRKINLSYGGLYIDLPIG